MNILILNGSPRPNGNTSAMVNAFVVGAKESNHNVTLASVCPKKIMGCLSCEYCHTKGEGKCIQEVYFGAIYEYQNSFSDYLKLNDMGVFAAFDNRN